MYIIHYIYYVEGRLHEILEVLGSQKTVCLVHLCKRVLLAFELT